MTDTWSVTGATREQRQAIADSLDDTRSWVDPRGYRLSDRLWLGRDADRKAIDKVLRQCLAAGLNPLETERVLTKYLTPGGMAGGIGQATTRDGQSRYPVGSRFDQDTQQWVDNLSRRGNYAARRLARTEQARAYGAATLEAAARNPWTAGVQWNLTGRHAEEDECDENAQANPDGLGRGVYKVENFPRFPNHPNCLCYVTKVAKPLDDVLAIAREELAGGGGIAIDFPGQQENVEPQNPFVPSRSYKELDEARMFSVKHEAKLDKIRAEIAAARAKYKELTDNNASFNDRNEASLAVSRAEEKLRRHIDTFPQQQLKSVLKAGERLRGRVLEILEEQQPGVGAKITRAEEMLTEIVAVREQLAGLPDNGSDKRITAELRRNMAHIAWDYSDERALLSSPEFRQSFADAHRTALGEVRQLGSTQSHPNIINRGMTDESFAIAQAHLQDTARSFPTEWWDRSVQFDQLAFKQTDRAYHQYGGSSGITEFGANSDGGNERVWHHEVGHRMDAAVPELGRLSSAYLSQRTGYPKAAPKQLDELIPGAGYGQEEKAIADHFVHVYAGKIYNDDSHSEVTSMGLDSAFGGDDNSKIIGDSGLWSYILGAMATI